MKSSRWLLASLITATAALAPRVAHADEAADIQAREARSIAHYVSELYAADGTPSSAKQRNCEDSYEIFKEWHGTDDYAIALSDAVKTPRVSWKKGESHTVGQLKGLCDQVDLELKRGSLLRELAEDVPGVAQRPQYIQEDRAKECLKDYDAIHAAGIPDSESVEVTTAEPANPLKNGTHTVGELRAFCLDQLKLRASRESADAQRSKLIGRMADVLQTVKHADDSPGAELKDLEGMTQDCNDTVDQALAAGTSPDLALEVQGGSEVYPWKGPLSKVKVEVCARAEATRKKLFDQRFGPFLKAGLKGDKFKMIYGIYPGEYHLPGGGTSLDPRKLAKANVWFEAGAGAADDSTQHCVANGAEVYTVTRYQFDANQNLAKTTTKSYCGVPPKSAYK